MDSDGYAYTDFAILELIKEFRNYKPSKLQKFLWSLWPTVKSIKWKRYLIVKNECLTG